MPERTERRVIVMTGTTRGLGRALLEAFIAQGHTVAGCGRSADRVRELQARFPAPHHFATVDLTQEAAVADWARAVRATVGVPDLLINNAALMNTPAPLWEVPGAEFDALFAVNVLGMARVIRHFVPAMVAARRGVIVNLSSGWGRATSPEVAPYCATKWAVEGLTRALAQELPSGMAAVPINPGVIDTDMLRQCWGESAGNYPNPAAWARQAAPFILALEARHNGQPLSVMENG